MSFLKKIFVSSTLLISFSLFAADTNTDVMKVQVVKSDFSSDSDEKRFYYMFTGGNNYPGGCGNNLYARSGDDNINKLLLMAYENDMDVKVGIDPTHACVITTVIVDKSMYTTNLY
ncbi:hypothetical protein ACVD2R_11405 [Escherichia coli]|nr:hypothetical protein [Escherichia coli]